MLTKNKPRYILLQGIEKYRFRCCFTRWGDRSDMISENQHTELKSQFNEDVDVEKEVIAFLNTREGGRMYIGIDKSGKVIGVQDIDKTMLQIKDRIKNNIEPSAMGLFDVVEEEVERKKVIKIIVAAGSEKPYYKKKFGMTPKGCYIRIGTASEPMTQHQIEKLFSTRTRNSIGKIKSPRQELSFEQLRIYYEEQNKWLNKQFKKNLELLTEDGHLNYVGYLLADENNISIKLAKYKGTTKVELVENNEYGYCSLIKAVKSVLQKIDIENKTMAKITARERIEKRMWQPVALREAIINAFVHNDYTKEIAPVIEIFANRIEITSAGTLPENLSQDEFFSGYSIPRNKELMRVFKDLELVEQLGSGIPRILQYYGKECFVFSENFTRITFPVDSDYTEQVTPQVTPQVEALVKVMKDEHTRTELMKMLGLTDREYFREKYIHDAIKFGLIEPTIPDKPTSSKQKYRLTSKGKEIQEQLNTKL